MSQRITDQAASSLAAMSVDGLLDHILARYHARHREELPDLIALARKVERVHHDVPEAPLGLADALGRITADIDAHMQKEEHVLFPAMRSGHAGGLSAPIGVMRGDHARHTDDIAKLEALTRGFNLPEGACGSWQRLYAGVSGFCNELQEHMRIENEVLFPRFELAQTSRCTCSHS
jgi:regulator of cell morphogenesis and NO signaling